MKPRRKKLDMLGSEARRRFQKTARKYDYKGLERGIFGSFSRNPVGTLIGTGMLFLTLFWLGSGVGPINNATIANDFSVIYNNASYLGLVTFALVFPTSIGLALIHERQKPMLPVEVEESQESSTA